MVRIDTSKGRSLASLIARAPAGYYSVGNSENTAMPTQKLFTPRDAAQVLGISYPTLKQWIYKKQDPHSEDGRRPPSHPRKRSGPLPLPRHESTATSPDAAQNFRRISGRNQLVGRITDIKIDGLLAQVSHLHWRTANHFDYYG